MFFSRKPPEVDPNLHELVQLLKEQRVQVTTTPNNSPLLSAKNVNALVIAAIIAAFAFLWTNATQQPEKNATQFAAVATQTAEIRTTVNQMKADFDRFATTVNTVKSMSDTNTADIASLKKQVDANTDRIAQIEKDLR